MYRLKKKDSENPFWISISDLMSGLTMLFILIMGYAFLNINTANERQHKVFTILEEEFKKAKLDVDIDSHTGGIIIKDKILFNTSDTEINEYGEKLLSIFCPIMARVIFSNPEVKKEIVAIDIEGYASEKGHRPIDMMTLSLDRSRNVWEYIYNMEDFEFKHEFLHLLKVSGYGNMKASSFKDLPEDRKVVFQLQFRNLLESILDIFKLSKNKEIPQ